MMIKLNLEYFPDLRAELERYPARLRAERIRTLMSIALATQNSRLPAHTDVAVNEKPQDRQNMSSQNEADLALSLGADQLWQ